MKRLFPRRFKVSSVATLLFCSLSFYFAWNFWRSKKLNSAKSSTDITDGSSLKPRNTKAEESGTKVPHRTKLWTSERCPNPLFLLIMVYSDCRNFERRVWIRNTWGSDYAITARWKTVFLLGDHEDEFTRQRVRNEKTTFGDIIQGGYPEDFRYLVFKLAMGFEWATKYCSFAFLLKTDDDVFINTHGLVSFLKVNTTTDKGFFTGHLMDQSEVYREGRYGVPREQYNETYYKPYCSGGGFILSRDLVEAFYEMFDVVNPIRVEDAYLGILADKIGVKILSNARFRMYEDKCEYNADTLVQHPAKKDCLAKLFSQTMFRVSSYIYNQTVDEK